LCLAGGVALNCVANGKILGIDSGTLRILYARMESALVLYWYSTTREQTENLS